jgi:hypothetical protein
MSIRRASFEQRLLLDPNRELMDATHAAGEFASLKAARLSSSYEKFR